MWTILVKNNINKNFNMFHLQVEIMSLTKIDRIGRVTIPKEIRRELNLKENDELLVVRIVSCYSEKPTFQNW